MRVDVRAVCVCVCVCVCVRGGQERGGGMVLPTACRGRHAGVTAHVSKVPLRPAPLPTAPCIFPLHTFPPLPSSPPPPPPASSPPPPRPQVHR